MKLFSTIIAAFCVLFCQPIFAQTNGENLTCSLNVIYDQVLESARPPVCIVSLANGATNNIHFLRIPLEGCCEINLVDTNGMKVAKTKSGDRFQFWTDSKLCSWEKDHLYDGLSVVKISGRHDFQLYPSISIPEMFESQRPPVKPEA